MDGAIMGLQNIAADSEAKVRDFGPPGRISKVSEISRKVHHPGPIYLSRSGFFGLVLDEFVDYRLNFNTVQDVVGFQIKVDCVIFVPRTMLLRRVPV